MLKFQLRLPGLRRGGLRALVVLMVSLSLVAVGGDNSEAANPPFPVTVTAISGAQATNCFLATTGAVFCQGSNSFGQFGNGVTSATNSTPVSSAIGLPGAATALALGHRSACAIVSGEVWCWGDNTNGELGNGTTTTSYVPVKVSGLTGATAISASDDATTTTRDTTCAIAGGAAYCWGYGKDGELGNGSAPTTPTSTPVAVTGLPAGVSAISVGSTFACAIANGGAFCWGTNNNGTTAFGLGNATITQSNSPVAVAGLTTGVTSISVAKYHACAVASSAAHCWGYNSDGQLGNGTVVSAQTPVTVSTATGMTAAVSLISTGIQQSCAIAGGVAYCWGDDTSGELGNAGTAGDQKSPYAVTKTVMTGTVSVISAGGPSGLTPCAVATSGLFCWGYNNYGQLGDNTVTTRTSPVAVLTGAPGIPAAPSATATGTSATVTWSAPADNGSPITGYTVTSAPGGLTCTTTGALNCAVTGLTAGTAYTFTVKATNAALLTATSAASKSVTAYAIPTRPAAPTTTAGSSSITVTWAAPANNGSAIISYTVTATDTTNTGSGGQTWTGNALTYTFTGLTPGDSYTFTVTATNAAGPSTASLPSAAIKPYTTPSAPAAAPTATAGSSSATVTWTALAVGSNGGSGVTGYTVTATDSTNAGSGVGTCTTTGAVTCTVTGLTPGDSYTFTVAAVNAAGTGAASPPSNAVTPYTTPDIPTAPTATATGTSATVSWSAPANGYSPITGYTVTSAPGALTCTTTGVLSCTVTGLTAGTAYTFTVKATNAAGTSTSAASNSVTAYAISSAPGQPTAVKGSSSATVSWAAPTNNNGSAITGYTVTATDTTNAGRGGQTWTGNALTYTFTGLTPGDNYTFIAKATNAAGTSAASAASAAIMPYTTPSAAPATPTVNIATAGSAIITWTALTANSAAAGYTTIISYTVTATDSTNSGRGGTCSSAAATCTFSTLTPGDSYTFTVFATNAAGSGPSSSASASATPTKVTGAPLAPAPAPTATPGSSSATVSWTALTVTPTSYTVVANDSTDATRGHQNCTTTGATTSCIISALTPGDSYTFSVNATNASGVGPASPASTSVIPYTVPTAPTAPTATAGAGSASIAWSALATTPTSIVGYSSILGYTVMATDTTNAARGGQNCATTGALNCTVAGLTPGDSYTFTVTASNLAGPGPASASSSPAVIPYPTAPGTPTANPGSSQASVSWSAPTPNDNPATGYTVTATDTTNATRGGQTCTTTGALNCTVAGLTPGDSYNFTVTAGNAAGSGPASSHSNSVMPYTTPGTPAAPNAVAGINQATVTWSEPDTGYSPITSYTITTTDTTTSVSQAQPCTSPCTITGLKAGDSYTFKATASNLAGSGSASPASNSVTPTGVPAAPLAPTASVVNSGTTIVITWTAPSANGFAITGYALMFATGGSGGACSTTSALTCTVSGLTAYTSYTFTVHAANSVGTGANSPASIAVTTGAPDNSITMSMTDSSVTLERSAGGSATVSGPDGDLGVSVSTNNQAGYSLSVSATNLTPVTSGNSSVLSAGSLTVSGQVTAANGSTTFSGTLSDQPITVYRQSAPSAPTGSTHYLTFTAALPWLNADTYRGQLSIQAASN